MLLESCNSYPIRATTNMQTRLRCKRASMHRGSLDVDLTVDENLTLKSPHHYLVKLCKTHLMSLQLDSHLKVHQVRLHTCT
jgi:hypothetical protein